MVIYEGRGTKNRPETENYSYWQGDVALERIDTENRFCEKVALILENK